MAADRGVEAHFLSTNVYSGYSPRSGEDIQIAVYSPQTYMGHAPAHHGAEFRSRGVSVNFPQLFQNNLALSGFSHIFKKLSI
jgi:hypothetical protein